MKVKKVPLQDLELWPDEVICFTAYTDTRNPVQQRRTYVDGKKLKAENAELRADLDLAQRIIGQISHEGFELIDENAKLRELAENLKACNSSCGRCIELFGKCDYETELRELRVEVDA